MNTNTWIDEISSHVSKPYEFYGQHGEEGALLYIFENIPVVHQFCVEFGASNPRTHKSGSVTNYLVTEKNWQHLWMDGAPKYSGLEKIGVMPEWITAENIVQLFDKYKVPHDFDLLSIDIDNNDWWVLRSILQSSYKPSVICVEHNIWLEPTVSLTREYSVRASKDSTTYFGASLLAFKRLLAKHEYSLVYGFTKAQCSYNRKIIDIPGCNALFVRNDLLPCKVDLDPQIFHEKSFLFPFKTAANSSQKWITVDENGEAVE